MRVRTVMVAILVSAVAARAGAQTGLTTPTGHELAGTVGQYTYVEPGDLRISIHGPKFGGDYTGTLRLNERKHWFGTVHVRGSAGRVAYDGWCRPWLIRPESGSANGYALGLGSAFTCSEADDVDGQVDVRGLVGKDWLPGRWGLAPETGVGVRYLSNGVTGTAGFRTDTYVYLPVGLTARTRIASDHLLSLNAEYDVLLRGWQHTYQSKLGGGQVAATPLAPAFTIEGFTDFSFAQHHGWAVRAGAMYAVSRRWSVGPSYVHWQVGASPVSAATVRFNVNGVSAQQSLGAYEPDNTTDELFVNLAFHF